MQRRPKKRAQLCTKKPFCLSSSFCNTCLLCSFIFRSLIHNACIQMYGPKRAFSFYSHLFCPLFYQRPERQTDTTQPSTQNEKNILANNKSLMLPIFLSSSTTLPNTHTHRHLIKASIRRGRVETQMIIAV